MAGDIKLKAGTLATVGTTAATLANGATVLVGTVDNATSLDLVVDFELYAGFSAAPTPGTGIVLACYLVPYVDGTNPADVDATTPRFPGGSFVGNFEVVKGQAGAQRMPLQNCILNALKYDVYVWNQAGQTMATGAVLKAQPTRSQYT